MKKFLLLLSILCVSLSYAAGSGGVKSFKKKSNEVIFKCSDGGGIIVQVVTDDIIRIRKSSSKDFKESFMIESGFVYDNFPEIAYNVTEENGNVVVGTKNMRVVVDKSNSNLTFFNSEGKRLLQEHGESVATTKEGKFSQSFTMEDSEHYFGFGFMRDFLDARGHELTWVRKYRWNGATVPYFMSTNGYAYYSNTTFNHDFDFTEKEGGENYYSISTADDNIDYYIINGPSFASLIDRYTDLTGKSMMVPRWSFGAQYRLRYYGDQEDLLSIAKEYRDREIPCDIMALEPGWEAKAYSMNWQWSPERFPDPAGMLKELKDNGFHFDLWESGAAPTKNITDPNVRKEWFDKRAETIMMGVDMFKQDDPYPRSIISTELLEAKFSGEKQIDENLSPEEINNVANTFYTETVFDEYRKLTGKRAVVMFHAYNASVASHRWPFQWAGDFQAANGMINASLSGHAMVSYDIRNPYAAGWHQGFFTPFTVVDSWAYYREPWLYAESIEQSHRMYACLRSRLVPYLYTSLWQSHTTALPIERPMVLNYTDDPATYNMHSQYMVGDWLLLGLSDSDDSPAGEKIDFWAGVQKGNYGRIYLPKGNWINYWSGEEINCVKSRYYDVEWPEYCGGPLFAKAGAIIPQGQVKNYIGETADEIMTLDIYPFESSSYQLYEDDGETHQYEDGKYSTVDITSDATKESTTIKISARKGSYDNMPSKRSYMLKVHALEIPKSITVDGTVLKMYGKKDLVLFESANSGWYYDLDQKKAIVKLDKGWKFKFVDDEGDPMSILPPTARYERVEWDSSAAPADKNRTIVIVNGEKGSIVTPKIENKIPTTLEATLLDKTFIADGQNMVDIALTLRDGDGYQVKHDDYATAEVTISGEALSTNGSKSANVKLINGKAIIAICATMQPSAIEVKAVVKDLETKLNFESVKGMLQARYNPPEKVKLGSDGSWIPDNVSVYVNIKANNRVARNATNKIILNVYDKAGNLCDTYTQITEKGEAIFKDVPYYKRPAQCLFEVKCEGYETTTQRIFENTWDD